MKHGRVTCSLFTSTFYELYILVLLTDDVIRLRQGKMLINFFKTELTMFIYISILYQLENNGLISLQYELISGRTNPLL